MRRCTEKARYEFIRLMEQHSPLEKVPLAKFSMTREMFAKKLMRYGATLGRIAETQCNSPEYPAYAWKYPEADRIALFNKIDQRYQRYLNRLEQKEQRIQARVEDLCNRFGCRPVFQGDPRGNTLKIQVPDGYTNDWGREGICVPTS